MSNQISKPPVKIQSSTTDMTGTTMVDQKHCIKSGIRVFFCRLSVFGMLPAQPCVVCLCVMEAPCMCQSGWFGLKLGTGGGWGVGMDTPALTRDCPKPTVLIRITPIISLSCSLYFPPLTSLPSSPLSHPRICSLPLSCCSFSCSRLTLPSQPYSLPQKPMLHTRWPGSMLSLLFICALDLFWMITQSRFSECLFLMSGLLFMSYLIV